MTKDDLKASLSIRKSLPLLLKLRCCKVAIFLKSDTKVRFYFQKHNKRYEIQRLFYNLMLHVKIESV